MNRIYGSINNSIPKSQVKRVSFFFSRLLASIWTGQQRAIKPQELYNSLYSIDPTLRGYGFKDAYEFFKKFLNILHDDFKYIGKKMNDMKKNPQISKEIQEEWDVITNIKDYCDFSIISQTFKGKLCVRAQCTQCEFVYWCEEDFMGLALDIPEKDWKPLSEQLAASEKQKEKPTKEQNIFTKIFSSNKQPKPVKKDHFSLQEYLAYFCENSIISDKKAFFCEDCKMKVNVAKNCSFLTLPNILCIQISRFKTMNGQYIKSNENLNIPIDNLDMLPFMKPFEQYEQQFTQYELLGIVEHEKQMGGDQYNTYIKNYKNNMFYKFSNSQFKPFDMAANIKDIQPYLLYYKLKQKSDNALYRNLHSQVQLIKQGEMTINMDKSAYIPTFWYEKLKHLANPGIIQTQHLLCSHNKIKPDFFDCYPPKTARSANSILLAENSNLDPTMVMDMSQDNDLELETNYAIDFLKIQSVIVPKEIASYLLESYGGGPIIEANLTICQECIRIARNIKRRRKMEKEIIAKFDKKFTEESYIIDEAWMAKWKDFLYSGKKFFKRNFIKGMPPPGVIDNKTLLGPQNTLKTGLKKNVNFRIVNDYIWQIFKFLYTGGPALVINDYNSRKKNYQKPQLSKADIELLTEMLVLTDEKKYSDLMKTILTDDLTQNNSANKKPRPLATHLLQKGPNPQIQQNNIQNGSSLQNSNGITRQARSQSFQTGQNGSSNDDSNVKSINKDNINRAQSIDYSNGDQQKSASENNYQSYNGNPRLKVPPKYNNLLQTNQNNQPSTISNNQNIKRTTLGNNTQQINSSSAANRSSDNKNLDLNFDKIKL